jgi:hypothetical protein
MLQGTLRASEPMDSPGEIWVWCLENYAMQTPFKLDASTNPFIHTCYLWKENVTSPFLFQVSMVARNPNLLMQTRGLVG